jgi:ankyrin repeat protein
MAKAGVRNTILAVLLSLAAPASLAADRFSGPGASLVLASTLHAGEAHSILPGLFEAALLYAPRGQTPERAAPELYPLHWAALTDQTSAAEALLGSGIAVDSRDAEGRTPLMVAAAFDSRAVAELLLARGADPIARDEANGNTPLDFAASAGHREMAKLLLGHGASVDGRSLKNGETALHHAALYGQRKMIELLVAEGADLNAADYSGVRPLQYARIRRQWLAIDMLLALGARPDDMHDAVNAGDVAHIQALIASGGDVNAPGLFGTPLHLAVATGQTWIASMLIDAGADLAAEGDPANSHPLHLAAFHNKPDVARLLIDRGADLDARDALGRTALTVAAAYGRVAVGETLLAAGSDPFARDTVYRDTPIHWAALSGSIEMVELLLSFGVDINTRSGHNGEPPLHYAVIVGDVDLVRFLVETGADPSMRDYAGVTPIQFAAGRNAAAADAVALLRRLGGRE